MSTFRGFVICPLSDEGAVAQHLSATHRHQRVGQVGNEVAIAIEGRGIPYMDGVPCAIAGVEDGVSQFVVDGPEPDGFELKVGITVGLCLLATHRDPRQWSPLLRWLWSGLDSPSETGLSTGFAAYRWDLEASCFELGPLDAACNQLAAMSKAMDKDGSSYRITLFKGGWGSELGGLECSLDGLPSIGPDAYVELQWTNSAGEHCLLVANSGGDFELET
ncbi:MAG: hypothetical protein KDM63_18960 [Verrucomicrobiae bacterium]|nr:hypothetical protein [Verrucomicrobiae bacterium]